ncbi:hypothetical protein B0O99DRAFT_597433 [Bisporella sp. PMI_857]|nr:hypothetical protein B0O99DRAFT_597433 [Bisporella sp. PMI_857]
MRNVLRTSILLAVGVLSAVEADDHIRANAYDRRELGLSDLLAEIGVGSQKGGNSATSDQGVGQEDQGVQGLIDEITGALNGNQPPAVSNITLGTKDSNGDGKGSKDQDQPKNNDSNNQGKGQGDDGKKSQTITMYTTEGESTTTFQTVVTVDAPLATEGTALETKQRTMTVYETVTVDERPPVAAQTGTCAVKSERILSTITEHTTITVQAQAAASTLIVEATQQPQTHTIIVSSTVTVPGPAEGAASTPVVAAPVAPIVGSSGAMASGQVAAALPQPPAAQPTLATSITPVSTSVPPGLLIDTSSPPPVVQPTAITTPSSVVPTSAAAESTSSLTSETNAPAPILSSTTESVESIAPATPTPEAVPSSTQTSSTSTTSNAAAVPVLAESTPAATDVFSLQLTIGGAAAIATPGAESAAAASPATESIDIATFSLTSNLVLGKLGSRAQPTIAPRRRR